MHEEERNYCFLILLLSRVGLPKLRDFFINKWNSVGGFVPWTDCIQNGTDLLTKFTPLNYEKPKVQSGDTTTWDLSLFVKALLNSRPPFVPTTKKGLVAGLKCLKETRNKLCHSPNGKIENSEFCNLKSDVGNALAQVGAKSKDFKKVKKDVDHQLLNELLSLVKHCASQDEEILKQICARQEELKQEIKQGQSGLQQGQQEIKQGQSGLQQGQQEIKQGQEGLQQGQQEIKQGQSGLQQGQQELKQGQSDLQQGQQELKQGQSGLQQEFKQGISGIQQGLEQIIKEIPKQDNAKFTKLSSEDVKGFSEKLKVSIKSQTEFQPKLLASHSVPSIRTDDIFTSLMIQRGWEPIEMKASVRTEQLAQFNTPKACLIDRCQDIFINPEQDKTNPKSIQVIGKPGIGKSLFCQRLCRDWADGALFQSNECNTETSGGFDFVFLMTFRQLNLFENKEVSFRDILNHCSVDEHSVIDESLFEHLIEHPEKVLFMLDGYDEFSNRSRIYDCQFEQNYPCDPRHQMPVAALISKLLRKKVFSGSVVMVTSRTTESNELGGIHKDSLVEIAGFSVKQVKQFIERYFKSKREDIKNATKDHIVNNENLLSLAHIPMLCYLMCWCLEWHIESRKQTSLPTTITAIYSEVVEIFELKHHCKSQYRATEVPESYNVPPVITDTVEKLSQLAATTYLTNKFIFNDTDIRGYHLTDEEMDNLKSCGLITCGPSFRTGPLTVTREYCFSHLTLHEYFAALGFVNSGTIPKLKAKSDEMVLQFCAGLLSQKEGGVRLMETVSTIPMSPDRDSKESMVAAKLLREYGDKEFAFKIIEENISWFCNFDGALFGDLSSNRNYSLPNHNNYEDLVWLLECLNDFCKVKEDQMSSPSQVFMIKELKCSFEPMSDVNKLAQSLKHISCPIVTLKVRSYSSSASDLGSPESEIIEALPLTRITTLHCNDFSYKDLLYLSTVLPSTCITTLHITGNNVTDELLTSLSISLPSTCITTLQLQGNHFTDEGLSSISEVLRSTHITTLNLWGNGFTVIHCLSFLIEALSSMTHITTLHLKGKNFTAVVLSFHREESPSTFITTFHLLCANHICIDEELSSLLTQALPSTKLTMLRLNGYDISDKVLASLCQVLPSTSITTLRLEDNSFSDEGLLSLSEVLGSTKITTLHLKHHEFPCGALSSLCQRLPSNISTILFEGNCLTNEVLFSLTGVLPSTNITTLELKGFNFNLSPLSQALPSTQIATLHLEDHMFTYEDLSSLTQVLASTKLTTLRLSGHGNFIAEFASFIEVLPYTKITTLHLEGFFLDYKQITSLFVVLPFTLINTLLFHSTSFSDESLSSISRLLSCTHINTLHLGCSMSCIYCSLARVKNLIFLRDSNLITSLHITRSNDKGLHLSQLLSSENIYYNPYDGRVIRKPE
ncbi:NACHT, LRR and PYD domains-containing protein 14 [Exaiptasia diaphana]|uniref:NACHT domain-containing protein n=1 Tax=Exaiptasia diaphana TaxID=2652724 RepID=A0A913YRR8_EXADI|nr:NACHT, LRR and PYD domains-containing protein 14 [Exaiptasia diaphana]XP_028516821.1 NACHT, LRR and PYD domains-containing protein 14 [Exaiptasia diaphana]